MNTKQRKNGRFLLNYWYNESTTNEQALGRVWYNEAKEYTNTLAKKFKVQPIICAGVISALSPNNRWERNKIDAHAVLEAVAFGISPNAIKVCTYNRNKNKAFAIAKGNKEILEHSPKTYAFAHNISGLDTNKVTIDKWHLRAIQTKSKSPKYCKTTITPLQYKLLEKDCQKVAEKHNLIPSELQAIVWVTIRNRWMS